MPDTNFKTLTVRIPVDMHSEVCRRASEEHRTRTGFIINVLESYFKSERTIVDNTPPTPTPSPVSTPLVLDRPDDDSAQVEAEKDEFLASLDGLGINFGPDP